MKKTTTTTKPRDLGVLLDTYRNLRGMPDAIERAIKIAFGNTEKDETEALTLALEALLEVRGEVVPLSRVFQYRRDRDDGWFDKTTPLLTITRFYRDGSRLFSRRVIVCPPCDGSGMVPCDCDQHTDLHPCPHCEGCGVKAHWRAYNVHDFTSPDLIKAVKRLMRKAQVETLNGLDDTDYAVPGVAVVLTSGVDDTCKITCSDNTSAKQVIGALMEMPSWNVRKMFGQYVT